MSLNTEQFEGTHDSWWHNEVKSLKPGDQLFHSGGAAVIRHEHTGRYSVRGREGGWTRHATPASATKQLLKRLV